MAYANILNIVLPSEMGKYWYRKFLELFNNFIRKKDGQSHRLLYIHCLNVKSKTKELLSPFVNNVELSLAEVQSSGYKSDSYEPLMFGLIVHLRNYFGIKEFEIIYDPIKSTSDDGLKEFTSILNFIESDFIVSAVCKVHNDIKINATKSYDSKIVKQIQISDLIAGLTSYSFKISNIDGEISNLYRASLDDNNLIHKICSRNVTPAQLGTDIGSGLTMPSIETAFRRKLQ